MSFSNLRASVPPCLRAWAVTLAIGAAAPAQTLQVIDLGSFDVEGGDTQARDVNAIGQVVGYSTVGGLKHAFLWEKGVLIDLGTLGFEQSIAHGINDAGDIVGVVFTDVPPPAADPQLPFRYSNGVMSALSTLDEPGMARGAALDINNAGHVVGWSGNVQAVRWNAIGWILGLPYPGSGDFYSQAYAINDAGAIAGLASDVITLRPTRWINDVGQFVGPGGLENIADETFGINDAGFIVGRRPGFAPHYGARWNPSGGALYLGFSHPRDINNLGLIVGGNGNPFPQSAVLWDNGPVDLNALLPEGSPWVLVDAWAINDDGLIVGSGFLDGDARAFIAGFLAGPPPANDDCADATVITASVFSDQLDTSGASIEAGEIAGSCAAGSGHSVWYSFTPPIHGRISITTAGSDFPAAVSVFEGGCQGEELACGVGWVQDVFVTTGVECAIRISGTGSVAAGSLNVEFEYLPSAVPPAGRWTVMVHGATGSGGYPGIMAPILARIGSLAPQDIVMHTMNRDTFALVPPDLDPSKHHVVDFDWSETAGDFEDLPRVAGDGYAYAAAAALHAFLHHWGINDDVQCLIGYSRGGPVMSEVARRLVLDGTPPAQVVYLDAEGGGNFPLNGCGDGLTYEDCRFEAWGDNEAIRYDNIYSTVFELDYGCPIYWDFGGNHNEGCFNYDLGEAYRHGACGSGPPSIITYLADWILFDGSRYIFPDAGSEPTLPALDPHDWDGAEHAADRTLFNGNLEWGSDAGWNSHGAAGTGHVDNFGEDGSYLELDWSDEFLQHSWFYLRPEFDTLSFRFRVSDSDVIGCDDSLHAMLIRLADGVWLDWLVINRCDTTGWLTFTAPVPGDFRGEVCTIRFWKDPGGDGDLDSESRLDDVMFLVEGDVDGNGSVGVTDLLGVLSAWGDCATCLCAADLDGDCQVGIADLLLLLANWG